MSSEERVSNVVEQLAKRLGDLQKSATGDAGAPRERLARSDAWPELPAPFRGTPGKTTALAPRRTPRRPSGLRRGRNEPVGQILVDAGRIDRATLDRIAALQERTSLPFADAALQSGAVNQEDLDFALARQFGFTRARPDDDSLSPGLMAAFAPSHRGVESLRALRARLLRNAEAAHRPAAAVAIVSPGRGDGRSFIAANLAVVCVQHGLRALLVDADLRAPSLHNFFKLENRIGLSTVLAHRSGAESVRRIRSLPRLYVLPAGPTPPNSLELVDQPYFSELLAASATSFQVVIIDTPAGASGEDARAIAHRVGTSFLVMRDGHTRSSAAARFAKELAEVEAGLLGVVMNASR